MAVNLSIKEVPDALADRLRRRAARNHRSLQRELMAIVEAAVSAPAASAQAVHLAVHVAESAPVPFAPRPAAGDQPAQPAASIVGDADRGSLLAALDGIVAGSRWGHAPLLTREQANDRRLLREFEFDARQPQTGAVAP